MGSTGMQFRMLLSRSDFHLLQLIVTMFLFVKFGLSGNSLCMGQLLVYGPTVSVLGEFHQQTCVSLYLPLLCC